MRLVVVPLQLKGLAPVCLLSDIGPGMQAPTLSKGEKRHREAE
jgi:hypothetical protein